MYTERLAAAIISRSNRNNVIIIVENEETAHRHVFGIAQICGNVTAHRNQNRLINTDSGHSIKFMPIDRVRSGMDGYSGEIYIDMPVLECVSASTNQPPHFLRDLLKPTESGKTQPENKRISGQCSMCGIDLGPVYCPKCYKAVQEEPENKPLTMEQLWQMDNEPVWTDRRCGVVRANPQITRRPGMPAIHFNYGWEWADDVLACGPVYARKPEREGETDEKAL